MFASGANIAGAADPRLPIPGHEDAFSKPRTEQEISHTYDDVPLSKDPAVEEKKSSVQTGDDATIVAPDDDRSSLREKKHRNSVAHSSDFHHGPQHLMEYIEHAGRQRQIEVAGDDLNSSAIATEDLSEHERERLNARRALRSASWAAVFFLITTDILGPFNAPYAFSQVGYVPGVLLYFFLGAVAFYTGCLLSYLFNRLDSDRYPVTTYSDLGVRIFGPVFKHVVTFLQTIQLIVNVGTIILSNAENLELVVKGPSQIDGRLCFAAALIIWMVVGMMVGQIRTLKAYGWIANFAVWINLLIIFLTMGFVAHSPPNYASAESSLGVAYGPIVTSTFVGGPLYTQVQGMLQMVFAYGGAMIFPEMMAEMRRPMDFWKGMACAQALIFCCYMMFGIFVYSFQGQFSLALAYQGVSKYAWATIGNTLAMVTGIIAAGLYGNIGIKVSYINIVEGWCNGPPLMSKKGRIIWTFMVLVYWALAFIVAAAIPQVATISSLIAAAAIFQFSYTFPPFMVWGFLTRRDAFKNGTSWVGAMFHGSVKYNLFKAANFALFLACLATAGLGLWAAGTAIKETFEATVATSFSCTSPV